MNSYPIIVNEKYNQMGFSEIDKIREKIVSGQIVLTIKKEQSMLYLNQMLPKYKFILKSIQNFSILGLLGSIIFLFINWKISIVLFPISILANIFVSKKALNYIIRNCGEDRVFLKFALSVGLAELKDDQPMTSNKSKGTNNL